MPSFASAGPASADVVFLGHVAGLSVAVRAHGRVQLLDVTGIIALQCVQPFSGGACALGRAFEG